MAIKSVYRYSCLNGSAQHASDTRLHLRVKNVVILGSTGSIGINVLKVIERFSNRFKVVGLSAYNNFDALRGQIQKFRPRYVAANWDTVSRKSTGNFKMLDLKGDLDELVRREDVDIVVIAMKGSAALKPFLSAVSAGKTVAPANKEALVVAGEKIMEQAGRHKAAIIPIDSEQSAIFQCLEGRNLRELRKVYLTASGGPLLNIAPSRFDKLSVEDILRHPRWRMGKKITVDSATLMNKGFEVIEARWLFNLDVKAIQVVIHPEAIIHSMVEFRDGSIIGQLGVTDMRLPIQFALTYPERLESGLAKLDFFALRSLSFRKPDLTKFPALSLAIYVGKKGGTLPGVLNAANEEAVEAFLQKKISFSKIYKIVEKVVLKHKIGKNPSLDQILEADQWAREESRKVIKE